MHRLLIALLAIGLIAAACGSASDDPDSAATGTATSERAERQTTVSQQQTDAQPEAATADPPAIEDDAEQQEQPVQAATSAEQSAPQAEQAEQQAQQAVPLPTDVVGEHKGVRAQANTLGEPGAAVVIEHFGDFT